MNRQWSYWAAWLLSFAFTSWVNPLHAIQLRADPKTPSHAIAVLNAMMPLARRQSAL